VNRICLCLTGQSLAENVQSAEKHSGDVDLVELRADFLAENELSALERFPAMISVPAILTIRREADGGRYVGPESRRIDLLSSAVRGDYAFLDIEEDLQVSLMEQSFRDRGGRIIRSIHSFSGMVPDIEKRIRGLKHNPTDLPKAAIQMGQTHDLITLVGLYDRLRDLEKILVGMGVVSYPLRILAGRLGSYLTFSSLPDREQAAKGHADPVTLSELYQYHKIGAETKIFAVIGNPIMHSFSPRIHNRGYSLLGLNAVYLPFQVDEITDFLTLAETIGIEGASVTIPLKEVVIPHLVAKTDSITATGACNTIVRKREGWQGENTDVAGFLTPLKRALKNIRNKSLPSEGRRATVIGAGGAARSIVYALCKEGYDVLVLNRTLQRAKDLADTFGCQASELSRKSSESIEDHNDLIVQTTSVGMHPDLTGDPLPHYRFRGNEVVYDIVYNPPDTPLLERAKKAGCRIIYGKEMLISQAEHQFKLFTGQDYPDPQGIDLDL
jgi:3-dehydroquinate dehydratase/shikimate dehydrogenase